MRAIHLLVALLVSSSIANAAAIGSRGGKKLGYGIRDYSGYPIMDSDDKPWKVFETTQTGQFQILDEAGVAPKQGMVRQVCISSVSATTEYVVVYDSNTATGENLTVPGIRLGPPFIGSTTKASCLQLNAQFNSGLVIEVSTQTGTGASGSAYVYWRELGGVYK